MPGKKKYPNIIFFGIDSIRADHMSCYGYERQTTPNLDKLASQGVLFENYYSPIVPTTPAYTHMMTGKDVISTGVVSLHHSEPVDYVPWIAEMLGDVGYQSVCVGFGGGFYRGFDKYLDYKAWVSYEDRPAYKANNLNDVTLPELDRMAADDQPFFLFLRHMDPHSPYLPPKPYDRMFYSGDECDPNNKSMEPVFDFEPFADFFKSWMPPGVTDKEYVNAQYDGELAYMDGAIQQLLTRVEELGIAEDTIIIVNGDHGETLDEHDCYYDHHGLYEPTLYVPLIIRWPGHLPEGAFVPGYCQHIDVVPTILELIGADVDAEFDGDSLVPMINGEKHTNASEFYIAECTWMRKQGWRTTEWKFFEALEPDFHDKPPVELYNLVADPLELNNLAESEPGMVIELRRRMNEWLEMRMKETGRGNPILEMEIGLDRRIGSVAKAKNLQEKD
jgi:arylsulfatase A-like enzyme